MNKNLTATNEIICPHCKHRVHVKELGYDIMEGQYTYCEKCNKTMEFEYVSEPVIVVCTKKTKKG